MNEDSRLIRGIKKRRKRFIAVLKVALVFYLMIFSFKYVTSSTSAYFTDSNNVNFKLTAGTWQENDNSMLEFPENANDNLKACPAIIEVIIKNKSENDMLSPSKYKIYFTDEKGNPEKHGVEISSGDIPKLKSNQEVLLQFQTEKEGFYQFYALQTNESAKNIWSKKIKVKCKNDNSKNKETEILKEEPAKDKKAEPEKTDLGTKTSEDPGTDETSNETQQNNEQSPPDEKEEIPTSTSAENKEQSEEAVNNTVPDSNANASEEKEKEGQ